MADDFTAMARGHRFPDWNLGLMPDAPTLSVGAALNDPPTSSAPDETSPPGGPTLPLSADEGTLPAGLPAHPAFRGSLPLAPSHAAAGVALPAPAEAPGSLAGMALRSPFPFVVAKDLAPHLEPSPDTKPRSELPQAVERPGGRGPAPSDKTPAGGAVLVGSGTQGTKPAGTHLAADASIHALSHSGLHAALPRINADDRAVTLRAAADALEVIAPRGNPSDPTPASVGPGTPLAPSHAPSASMRDHAPDNSAENAPGGTLPASEPPSPPAQRPAVASPYLHDLQHTPGRFFRHDKEARQKVRSRRERDGSGAGQEDAPGDDATLDLDLIEALLDEWLLGDSRPDLQAWAPQVDAALRALQSRMSVAVEESSPDQRLLEVLLEQYSSAAKAQRRSLGALAEPLWCFAPDASLDDIKQVTGWLRHEIEDELVDRPERFAGTRFESPLWRDPLLTRIADGRETAAMCLADEATLRRNLQTVQDMLPALERHADTLAAAGLPHPAETARLGIAALQRYLKEAEGVLEELRGQLSASDPQDGN